MPIDLQTEMELNRLVHHSARFLDDHDFDAYLQLFADPAEYLICVTAPEVPQPMIWMQQTIQQLSGRITAMKQHEWEIARLEQTRLVSLDTLSHDGQLARTSSSFALYHTDQAGRSACYAVGRYEDSWQHSTGRWLLSKRQVVLKTRLLDRLSPLPV